MPSFSIPLSGLTAASDQLQSISNNLANLNTDGFKSQNLSFADLIVQAGLTNGSGDPLQTGSGVKAATTDSNFTEGNLNPTQINSNMAVSGNGFFITQTPNPSGSNTIATTDPQYYTRAGDFTANAAGYLTTPTGDLVLGYQISAAGAGGGVLSTATAVGPLLVKVGMQNPTITQVTPAVDTLNGYSILANGTISGTFTSGVTVTLGQVAVASVANTQGLAKVGNSNYEATLASGTIASGGVVVGVPGAGGRGTVVGGEVEQSNVDLATEFSKLIVAQQYYSANAKTITTFNQVSQSTIAMLQ